MKPLSETLKGPAHELKFWRDFVRTERFLKGWVAHTRTPELQEDVYHFIMNTRKPEGIVLDVGSGVVSLLNGTVPKDKLTAADPLGELYECIFDYKKYGIKPPRPYSCEKLEFADDTFDIVHISNALDHTQDPQKAISELFRVCKRGGFVIIQGFENEANYENWKGFHQWNIELTKENTLNISNREGLYAQLRNRYQLSKIILPNEKNWYIWISQK